MPSFSQSAEIITGNDPNSVAVGDLNGDGKPDIVVANEYSDDVSVLLNNTIPGDPTQSFLPPVDYATGVHPVSVAIRDLNGDGLLDIIVVNESSYTASVLLNTTAPGASNATFAGQQTFDTGAAPFSVETADLNGDGKPDLIVANANDNSTSVLLNTTVTGATTLTFADQQVYPAGAAPRAVTVADLNGDGLPDLIIADDGGPAGGYVSVLLNTTVIGAANVQPGFPLSAAGAVSSRPFSVAMGDLNGDGRPDLVVADFYSFYVSVLLNTTAPGATAPTFAPTVNINAGPAPASVAVADFNGDGMPDIVVAVFGGEYAAVILNTTVPGATTPTFAPTATFATGNGPTSVAVADLNGDGLPDLVVANEISNNVSVLLNTTAPGATPPTFAPATNFNTGSGPRSVAVADLNGDGLLDLVVANSTSGNVSVLMNTAAPGATVPKFSAAVNYTVGTSPLSVAVGDLNGDGKPDIVVANFNSKSVSVLLNTTTAGTPPTFAPKVDFAVGLNPRSVAIADINGDGKPDLLVANQGYHTASVLLNTTTPGAAPSFTPDAEVYAGSGPLSLAVGDFNGDGRPDIAVADYFSNSVSVMLNTPGLILPTGSPPGSAVGTITESDPEPSVQFSRCERDYRCERRNFHHHGRPVGCFRRRHHHSVHIGRHGRRRCGLRQCYGQPAFHPGRTNDGHNHR